MNTKSEFRFPEAPVVLLLVAMWLSPAMSHAESFIVGDVWSLEMFYNRSKDGGTAVTTVNYLVSSNWRMTKHTGVALDAFARVSPLLKAVYSHDNAAAISIWPGEQTGKGAVAWTFEAPAGKVFDDFTVDPATFCNASLSVRLNDQPQTRLLLKAAQRTSPGVIHLRAPGKAYDIGPDTRRIDLIATTSRTGGHWYDTLMFRTPNAGGSPALSIRARTCTPDMVGKTDRGAAPDRSPETTQLLQELAPILFVARRQYKNVHGPDETMYQPNEGVAGGFTGGSALKVLDASTGEVRTLLELPEGNVRDPSVHFDGKRILLSIRKNAKDSYHLYVINSDGTGLKQLTSAPNVTDIQPVWLPNGRIMFSSTREPKYIHCQRHLMANLFLMEEDGANIRQVGFNTLFEGRSSLLPDGRVLYSRWEYVDKHFSSAYGLWTAYPDGTQQQLYYGGLSWQPGAMLDARAIPGTRKLVCIFGSVHGHENGAMVVVDPEVASEGPETILHTWPDDISDYMRKWKEVGRVGSRDYDSFRGVRPEFYQNPFPLSETHYLCTRTFTKEKKRVYGLFLVDTFGNETLLHYEEPGCFQPVPLRPSVPPPVIPDRIGDPRSDEGVFYVNDVYGGPEMDGVPRGTVKWLRVVEAPAKLTYPPGGHGDWAPPGDGDGHHPTALNWNHYNSKRVLGTVPVQADGSACFTVPARRFVYFQLLDAKGKMVHSMRSGTALLPGEQQGCVGCHSYRIASAADNPAIQRPPETLKPWHGGTSVFNYAEHIQPILDQHCVKCHDHGKEGEKINLSGDHGLVFNSSYVTLMSRSPDIWKLPVPEEEKPLISTIGAGPVPSVPPRSWGSSRSRLIDMLEKGHQSVKLNADELKRVIEWIDLNAPYYPFEQDYYTLNTYGRSPLNHTQLAELGKLVRNAPKGEKWGWTSVRDYTHGALTSLFGRGSPPINFTRPELSPCLQAFDTPDSDGYAAALALIKTGKAMLAEHPRADMSGFKPCAADQKRLDFYQERKGIEIRNREAMLNGSRAYD